MVVPTQLFQLERLDADLTQRAAELAETRRRQGRNTEIEAAEARLAALRVQEQAAGTEQRALDAELASLETRIKRDQTRMYGGQIVDSRELASLEKELQHYRAQRDEMEDRLLLVMEQQEEVQEAVHQASRQANEVRDRWEANRPALARQAEAIEDALAGLRAERDALAASIDPQALNLYERLRHQSGHAVSHVDNGICQWCRVGIPPKDVQHARAGALVTCTNCARILHVAG